MKLPPQSQCSQEFHKAASLVRSYTPSTPQTSRNPPSQPSALTPMTRTYSPPTTTQIQPHQTKWRLKINETKSKHIIFTLRRGHCPPVYFNTAAIPRAESIKYLGLHFDKQLNWKKHVTTTRKHLDLKSRDCKFVSM